MRRRRRSRRHDLRTRLALDARRVSGFMASVLADAQRVGAPVDEAVDACAAVWRSWADRVTEWAKDRND